MARGSDVESMFRKVLRNIFAGKNKRSVFAFVPFRIPSKKHNLHTTTKNTTKATNTSVFHIAY